MKYFTLCLLFFCSYYSFAQITELIVLVKDINSQGDSHVKDIIAGKQYVFFTADDGLHGSELWKSDGTNEGTALVKDINPGSNGSNLNNMIYFRDTLYFVADDGVHGYELWKSDGTTEGTLLIIDINAGSTNSFPPPNASSFGVYDPNFITGSGDLIYFRLDETNDKRLWRTNGKAAGTYPVSNAKAVSPGYLTDVNGVLYFAINDKTGGASLWKSDGTIIGTQVVINTSGKDRLSDFVASNGILFFVQSETDDITAITIDYLWQSDGTLIGTIKAQNSLEFLILKSNLLNGYLYFSGASFRKSRYQPNPIGLMRTNGDVMNSGIDGPYFYADQLNTISPINLQVCNGVVYFTSKPGKLNKIDGANNTVELLEKFRNNSYTLSLSPINTTLYALVNDGSSIDLWKVKDPVVCQILSQNLGVLKEEEVVGEKLFMAIQSLSYGGTEIFVYDAAKDQDALCRVQQTIIGFDVLPSRITTDPPFMLQATSSSGLPISFSSSNEQVAVLSSGNTVTIKGGGETFITATQPGNNQYLAATAVTQQLVVNPILSVGENILFQNFTSFSNPFSHDFVIRVNETTYMNYDVEIYNSIGALTEGKVHLFTNIDYRLGSSWLPGIYFVKVTSGNQVHIEKVIKQ